MTRILLIIGLSTCIRFGYAQSIGHSFPDIEVETVESKKVILPKDIKGKYSIIGLAYSQKSEDDLMGWFDPVYQKFVKESTGFLMGLGYDVNVYFIPMFTGINTAVAGVAKKAALKNVALELLPHILFYKGNINTYVEELNLTKKHVPYFFVLDPDGQIVYATSGKYNKEKMDRIEDVIE